MEGDLKSKFEAAAQKLRDEGQTHDPKPTKEEFLVFYGFYKQATVGDCNTGFKILKSVLILEIERICGSNGMIQKVFLNHSLLISKIGTDTEEAMESYIGVINKFFS